MLAQPRLWYVVAPILNRSAICECGSSGGKVLPASLCRQRNVSRELPRSRAECAERWTLDHRERGLKRTIMITNLFFKLHMAKQVLLCDVDDS